MSRFPLLILALVGCDKSAGTQPTDATTSPASLNQPHVMIADGTLRLAPSDDGFVPHPQDFKRSVNNSIGLVGRGQSVTVRQLQPGWAQVVLPDGAEGWVHANDMIAVSSVTEMTVIEETPTYANAEMHGMNAVVHPGDLLFVLATTPTMSRVHVDKIGEAWIPTSKLVSEAQEVAMSHMIIKTRQAAAAGDNTEILESLDEARIRYPTSPLIQVIADQADFSKMHATPRLPTSNLGFK